MAKVRLGLLFVLRVYNARGRAIIEYIFAVVKLSPRVDIEFMNAALV